MRLCLRKATGKEEEEKKGMEEREEEGKEEEGRREGGKERVKRERKEGERGRQSRCWSNPLEAQDFELASTYMCLTPNARDIHLL